MYFIPKKMHLCSLLLLGIFLCVDQALPVLAQTKKNEILKSELIKVGQSLSGVVFQVQSVENFLLIKNKQEDTYFTLIDLKSPQRHIVKTGIIGPNAGELYNPGAFMPSIGSFSVLNDRSLITFNLDSILDNPSYVPRAINNEWINRPVINVVGVGDGYYVTNEVTANHRFSLVGANGEILCEFGEFPDSTIQANPNHVKNLAYQAEFTSNTVKNRIAAATRYGEYIAFYQIDIPEKEAEITHEYIGELPLFAVDKSYGEPNFGFANKTKAGYLSLSSNENFVVALYLGEEISKLDQENPVSDIIQVFNWEGQKIATLNLDRKLSAITLNSGKLYGIYRTGDRYSIAKFSLPTGLSSN